MSSVRQLNVHNRQGDLLTMEMLLVNNAGVATLSYQTTPARFEVAMGVKYVFDVFHDHTTWPSDH